jgi:hypothetical protein
MLQRILRLQRAIRLARADARPVLSLAGLRGKQDSPIRPT